MNNKKLTVNHRKNSIPYTDLSDMSDFNHLPPIEVYLKNLEDLNQIERLEDNLEKIKAQYFKCAGVMPYILDQAPGASFNNNKMYRVRTGIQPLENIESRIPFWTPRKEYVKNYNGRANLKGEPVLYCSDNVGTCILESRINIGDIGYLCEYDINCQNNYIFYNSIVPFDLNSNDLMSHWSKGKKELIQKYFPDDLLPYSDHLNALYNYLAKVFAECEYPYVLSSWISHKIFNFKKANCAFIIYPSAAAGLKRMNIVFKPSFANKYLSISSITKFQVILENEKIILKVLDKGFENQSRRIIWQNYADDEDQRILNSQVIDVNFSATPLNL